ncbi:MAG: class I SAM-dependent RNA methyltransferase [Verrucomicrobiota bacterium]
MYKKRKFNDTPFTYHQEIEFEITTLTNLGSGLGRIMLPKGPADNLESEAIANQGGWVVMVPFTLPGEHIRARIFRNHKNYSEADLLEVLTPSKDRVTPICSLFGRCGGCQYQHLSYSAQLMWKKQQVTELLKYMAGLEFAVEPVIGSPKEFGYRSKITPHFAVPTVEKGSDFPIGFLKQSTRFELVDVPQCPIATDLINQKLPEVRARIKSKAAEGLYSRGATVLLREASAEVVTDYEASITEHVLLPAVKGTLLPEGSKPITELKLKFLARDFFQNNPFILPLFIDYVRSQAAASGAHHLVDAYCGSGLFALSAAALFKEVAGIEISATSVACAKANAVSNGINNAQFQTGEASAIFAGLLFPASDTVVVIDPPRKGCDESFLNQLFAYSPKAVVYVSCDPATQMRDLKPFLNSGYRVKRIQPFDLFPQTRHLECVITLEKII